MKRQVTSPISFAALLACCCLIASRGDAVPCNNNIGTCTLPIGSRSGAEECLKVAGQFAADARCELRENNRTFVRVDPASSDLQILANDAAVILSLALQHGVILDTIRHGVAREESGRPQSIVGAVVDAFAAEVAAP